MSKIVHDGGHAARDLRRGFMTKHIVKGAAGGTRGVDYQDFDAEYLEKRDGSDALNARASNKEAALATRLMKEAVKAQGSHSEQAKQSGPVGGARAIDTVDSRQVVNVTASKVETEKVDPKIKLADEKVKRKLLLQNEAEEEEIEHDDDESDANEEDIEWVGPFADHDVDGLLASSNNDQILRLIQDPEVEMRIYGTLRLLDPSDMREALGTSLRVARHLRVVAERMLASGEFKRNEIIHYLTGSMINMGKEFGGSAMRAFAH